MSGSGGSYRSYSGSLGEVKGIFSNETGERQRAAREREARLREERERIAQEQEEDRKKREREREKDAERFQQDLYDKDLIKNKITSPAEGVNSIQLILVDNSGSNSTIARHFRISSQYFSATMNALDPLSQVAFIYFSDHQDGDRFKQEIDFFSTDEEGSKVLFSSLKHVRAANGFDEAEAIECALYDACKIDFKDAVSRHLYLVTDVVAHGMGMLSDDGCQFQRDWRVSLSEVSKTFTTFQVVGCGNNKHYGELQRRFLAPDRVAFDLIDLSTVESIQHRLALSLNALLFLIARNLGKQTVQLFLSSLYEKWLSEPIFGKDTDRLARQQIRRFAKYLEYSKEEVEDMMKQIFME